MTHAHDTSPETCPRCLVVERLSMTIEGHTLTDVRLSGWVYGPDPGTAPAAVIVGGITASPFPFVTAAPSPPPVARPGGRPLARRISSISPATRCSARAGRETDRPGANLKTHPRRRRSQCPGSRISSRHGSKAAAAPCRSPSWARASAAWSVRPLPCNTGSAAAG